MGSGEGNVGYWVGVRERRERGETTGVCVQGGMCVG